MGGRRRTPEQLINNLGEAEVAISEGRAVAEVSRRIRVLTEQHRQTYNCIRPRSSLDYRPPAPEVPMP